MWNDIRNSTIATIIVLVGSSVVSRLFSIYHYWFFLAVFLAVIITLIIVNFQKIKRRYLKSKIFQEVSSSKCNDLYVEYATKYLLQGKVDIESLRQILEYRKHPNLSTFRDIEQQVNNGKKDIVIRKNLMALPHRKKILRHNVTNHVARFLKNIDENAILVLYGYSTTVCDSIAGIARHISNPIFLIEDLQYGIDVSLGEHKIAANHLEKKGCSPYIIGLDKIPQLLDKESHFINSVDDKLIPLPNNRILFALIGCEAYDLSGNVYIPSLSSGKSSESAKFIEVFKSRTSISSNIVVVSESYKLYRILEGNELNTYAPFKFNRYSKIMYYICAKLVLSKSEIKLVKIGSSEIYSIIDDQGEHKINAAEFDLTVSFANWRKPNLANN